MTQVQTLNTNEAMAFMMSLGNRIDSFWQRYLYMTATFVVVFGSTALDLHIAAKVILIFVYFYLLYRTGNALVASYAGLDAIISDKIDQGLDIKRYPRLTTWIGMHSYTQRWKEVAGLFLLSACLMAILAFFSEAIATGFLGDAVGEVSKDIPNDIKEP